MRQIILNIEADMKTFLIISEYDGLGISVMTVSPQCTPRAVLQIAHGICGRKERFLPFMEHMAANGIICIANDHRGHGGSVLRKEDLGYMYKGGYKALVSDMRSVTGWIRKEYPDLPFFLLGHSMGSLAARLYVKNDDCGLSGLILCGTPSENTFAPVGRLITGALNLSGLGRIRPEIFQKITSGGYNRRFRNEGFQAWTCSDPQVRSSVSNDPLCNYTCTANASYNLLCMLKEAYSDKNWKIGNPDMGITLLSGEDDPCTKWGASLKVTAGLFEKMGYRKISMKTYPGMRHEILNEKDKETVWNDILDFIVSRHAFYLCP